MWKLKYLDFTEIYILLSYNEDNAHVNEVIQVSFNVPKISIRNGIFT